VRKALVADLRKGLNWDKKFKKTHNTVKKRLRAVYQNVGPDVFLTLFPHASRSKGAMVAKLTVAQLGVDHIEKGMRYGGRLTAVEGTLSAKCESGEITVSRMYTYTIF